MWRPPFTVFRNLIRSGVHENRKWIHAARGSRPRQMKIALIGAGAGLAIGAGYGGYTHYLVNANKTFKPVEYEDYAFLKEPPEYTVHYRVVNERDTSKLKLVLFQYRTCPFCCKVRAYLDARGLSYDVVEVDAVLRQAIKWSSYKKVPILLAKVDGGYQQLHDSTAIISVLETYLRNQSSQLRDIVKFYPSSHSKGEDGNTVTDIANKYFVMQQDNPMPSEAVINEEIEERRWRQWADGALVHTLSPAVYGSAAEALETFRWFERAGGWREHFPAWECALMVYGGAAAMWLIAKRLKAKYHIDNARNALYSAAQKWMAEVKKKGTPFLGGQQPNLADISVFGVLSSIEGCRAFHELRERSGVGEWYDRMKQALEHQRGKEITCSRSNPSLSLAN